MHVNTSQEPVLRSGHQQGPPAAAAWKTRQSRRAEPHCIYPHNLCGWHPELQTACL